jgi:hypothetical protein
MTGEIFLEVFIMKKIVFSFLLLSLLNFSLFAQYNIFSKIHLNYVYSSNDDYVEKNGNHNLVFDYVGLDFSGPLVRKNITGRITYELLENELENAYILFSNLGYSDISIQVGQQYNIFGLKNREGEAFAITPTVEQEPENKVSAINSKSVIINYPIINVGSWIISFQDEGDSMAKAYKNYTTKLLADKIMEGVNLSISYGMHYIDAEQIYKPQYSVGLAFDVGNAGLSVEHININNNIVTSESDCKLLSIETYYNYSDKTMFLFDYIKADDDNFYNSIKAQTRIGTNTEINENLFLLLEWGQDKFYDDDYRETWYKCQLRAFF